jgi:hypothetical protein
MCCRNVTVESMYILQATWQLQYWLYCSGPLPLKPAKLSSLTVLNTTWLRPVPRKCTIVFQPSYCYIKHTRLPSVIYPNILHARLVTLASPVCLFYRKVTQSILKTASLLFHIGDREWAMLTVAKDPHNIVPCWMLLEQGNPRRGISLFNCDTTISVVECSWIL